MTDINEQEEIYKSKLDKLQDYLGELGYVRIRYSLKELIMTSIEKQKKLGKYDFRRILEQDFLEINVIADTEENTTWLHKDVFNDWPDNELYDELVEKGILKKEFGALIK